MYGSAGAGTNRPVLRLNPVLLRSCVVSWDLRFSEPIVLDDGSKLSTLRQAIAHLGKIIPKAEHDMPEILTAAELLTNAAEHGGPIEFARIATLQAINRHVGRVFDPSRKDTNGDAES
jgi:hypothetical protein